METCSGRMRRSWPTDASQDSRVWCGRPAIRSMLILRNPAARRKSDGAKDVLAAMHAARGLQLAIVEGLRAEADAVEAGREPGGCLLRRDRFGIGFEGDFRELRAARVSRSASRIRASSAGSSRLGVPPPK